MTIELSYINILVGILVLVIIYLLGRVQGGRGFKGGDEAPKDILQIYQMLQVLPTKVLQTIQGSINPHQGKMAELLTYAELRYDYDRIIPLGWPIDFIGIKNNERVDFIEVKSGSSLLTEEEAHIKNLISRGEVYFRLIKVSDSEIKSFVSAQRKG